jgi:hypothetical protein
MATNAVILGASLTEAWEAPDAATLQRMWDFNASPTVQVQGAGRVTIVGPEYSGRQVGGEFDVSVTPIRRDGEARILWVRSNRIKSDDWDPFFIVGLVLTILG